MPELKRSTKIVLLSLLVVAALLYALILMLQRSDASTIKVAREVGALVTRYCEDARRVPSLRAVLARYPNLSKEGGWNFFSDTRTYFKMQYPVKWWNADAIGAPKLSEFTATPYAYVVEYRCNRPK